jgi:hypothetical protein
MTKVRDGLLDKVIWPLLLLAFTPAATLIGSRIQSGEWLTWLTAIPSWAYTAFFAMIGLWFVGGIVIRRFKALKQRNLPSLPMAFTVVPRWGYTIVGTLNYKGVIWRVRIPSPAPWKSFSMREARSSRVDIETPPHCPKCDTELEETETFFGGHRWTCLRCGFSIKNEISFYREAIRAEKLAQSWWEKESAE